MYNTVHTYINRLKRTPSHQKHDMIQKTTYFLISNICS